MRGKILRIPILRIYILRIYMLRYGEKDIQRASRARKAPQRTPQKKAPGASDAWGVLRSPSSHIEKTSSGGGMGIAGSARASRAVSLASPFGLRPEAHRSFRFSFLRTPCRA